MLFKGFALEEIISRHGNLLELHYFGLSELLNGVEQSAYQALREG